MRLNALLRLAFATAPSFSDLTLPHSSNSSAHSSKGTPSHCCFQHSALTVCKHSVSGSISLPLRGSFRLSSRYLFTIGRQEYLVLEGGPPRFTHERPSTRYSGDQPRSLIASGYGALTLYGLPFQAGSPNDQICDFARIREDSKVDSYNPETATAPAYHAVAVWTVPFSLATTQGIDIFSSSYLDVSVRWLTFRWPMYSATDDWALPQPGFPIRTSSDHCLLATPRSFSQPATSFIGSWRQGIHLVLLVA